MSAEGCFFTARLALWYSLQSTVRRGVYQGLGLGEGRERGVSFSNRAVRESREEENQSLSWVGEGRGGEEGVRKASRRGRKASQSVRSQQGVLGGGLSVGGAKVMRMGTWSEPVEGREVESHAMKVRDISGLAKARSIAPGLWDPERGKRV